MASTENYPSDNSSALAEQRAQLAALRAQYGALRPDAGNAQFAPYSYVDAEGHVHDAAPVDYNGAIADSAAPAEYSQEPDYPVSPAPRHVQDYEPDGAPEAGAHLSHVHEYAYTGTGSITDVPSSPKPRKGWLLPPLPAAPSPAAEPAHASSANAIFSPMVMLPHVTPAAQRGETTGELKALESIFDRQNETPVSGSDDEVKEAVHEVVSAEAAQQAATEPKPAAAPAPKKSAHRSKGHTKRDFSAANPMRLVRKLDASLRMRGLDPERVKRNVGIVSVVGGVAVAAAGIAGMKYDFHIPFAGHSGNTDLSPVDHHHGAGNATEGITDANTDATSNDTGGNPTPPEHTTREAVSDDPDTGRASNVTDWSRDTIHDTAKDAGLSEGQANALAHDQHNVTQANHAFYGQNESVAHGNHYLDNHAQYQTDAQHEAAQNIVDHYKVEHNIPTDTPADAAPDNPGDSAPNTDTGSPVDATSDAQGHGDPTATSPKTQFYTPEHDLDFKQLAKNSAMALSLSTAGGAVVELIRKEAEHRHHVRNAQAQFIAADAQAAIKRAEESSVDADGNPLPRVRPPKTPQRGRQAPLTHRIAAKAGTAVGKIDRLRHGPQGNHGSRRRKR